MTVSTLADTGALLAYLDRNDRWHRACREAFPRFRLPVLTSIAVFTELFHLVGDAPREVTRAWDFLRSGAVMALPIADRELSEVEALMKKYRDRPMDFADATLVYLAERESISTVFTVDHDDFTTYRIGGRRRFTIVPDRLEP